MWVSLWLTPITRQMHCIMGASLSKLNGKSTHLVCSCERAEEVTRDDRVCIRFVGVWRGYKAMVEYM